MILSGSVVYIIIVLALSSGSSDFFYHR